MFIVTDFSDKNLKLQKTKVQFKTYNDLKKKKNKHKQNKQTKIGRIRRLKHLMKY